jgi:hypothetical protein
MLMTACGIVSLSRCVYVCVHNTTVCVWLSKDEDMCLDGSQRRAARYLKDKQSQCRRADGEPRPVSPHLRPFPHWPILHLPQEEPNR